MRTLDVRVAAKDQLLKILIASVTMKLKNRHTTSPLQKIWKKGQGVCIPGPSQFIQTIYNNNKFLPGKPAYFFSIRTAAPSGTSLRQQGSPLRRPTRLTGLAGRISPGTLAGVRPKKMQKARPVGQ